MGDLIVFLPGNYRIDSDEQSINNFYFYFTLYLFYNHAKPINYHTGQNIMLKIYLVCHHLPWFDGSEYSECL